MQTIALVGNGTWFDCGMVLKSYDVIIALDGGHQFCQKFGITPTITLGDGDSITDKPTNFIVSTDQTTTDLQKGLAYIQEHFTDYVIDLFGFVSIDRLDHTLTAIHLLYNHRVIRSLYTPYQHLRPIIDQIELKNVTSFSLLPIEDSATVEIQGAKWNGQFVLDESYSGLSNSAVADTVHISVIDRPVLLITPTQWT